MASPSEEFLGKVFLVTGASSGIGEATVLVLASKGASVTLCGQNEERLESVRQRCVIESGGHGDRFTTSRGDLQKAEVRKLCVQTTIDKFGKLDVLVPNAGITEKDGSVKSATEETYDKIMGVNVKAVFFLIQEALPYLERSKGCIVSVSSIVTSIIALPNTIYNMAKAAIDHMTHCLALDLAPKGIRVNAVNPSVIPTRIRRFVEDEAVRKAKLQEFVEIESRKQPLEGRLVTGREIGEAIAFLASEKASFVTGQCLAVDGGRRLMGPIVLHYQTMS